MKLTQIQNYAIQAKMAYQVGAETFDRLFSGIRFDGTMLYAFASNEDRASEIEDDHAPHIAAMASQILKKNVEIVVVMPKVLQ
jgi:hypothetical protein